MAMHHRTRSAVIVAALLAFLLALPAAAAWANHDPSPPYVASSQPGSYELYGFHHKQISATVNCWMGLQRRGSDGSYRWWGKCQGDGRQLAPTFSGVVLVASPNTWGPTTVTTSTASTVYAVGGWHQITDLAAVSSQVKARYTGGASTSTVCLESYVIRRGQRAAYAAPRSGC